jgi:hypothetical protein
VHCTSRYALGAAEIEGNAQLSGVAFADDNSNGEFDTDEWPLANQLVSVSPGTYMTTTNNRGFYEFRIDPGACVSALACVRHFCG